MKKLCLCLCLLFCFSAFAEIDLSEMSIEELFDLRVAVGREILSRKANNDSELAEASRPTYELYGGNYVAGREIEPGAYYVFLKDIEETARVLYFTVYDLNGERVMGAITGKGTPYYVYLEHGYSISFSTDSSPKPIMVVMQPVSPSNASIEQ